MTMRNGIIAARAERFYQTPARTRRLPHEGFLWPSSENSRQKVLVVAEKGVVEGDGNVRQSAANDFAPGAPRWAAAGDERER